MDRFSFVLGICLVELLAMVWLWALLGLSVGCVFVVYLIVGVGPTNIIRSRILFGSESVR